MRAAADYMMGRYRDAHNDLAGASFDSDRHAALWRGLTEARAGELERGRIPIWKRPARSSKNIQPEWQARAHLADAQAALGMGRLELADAALTRLPTTLTKDQSLEAELDQRPHSAPPKAATARPRGNSPRWRMAATKS